MKNILSELEPKAVWGYFEEITQIPRPSKKEEKIIEFLMAFGQKNGLETKRDDIGNVLIKKAATKGKENLKTVILQSHMDMVCEKNSDVNHDFLTDPIVPRIDEGWVKAEGTTLGADDGIGMAAQMALLTAKDIQHGPIECLFTVDEETGLTGAFALQPGFMDGKILLNLDSEDEGELFIGCAGGIDTLAEFKYKKEKSPKKSIGYKISITGLRGGHSGDEIHKGFGNSNKILNRILWEGTNKFNLFLSEFDGGNLRNAIPREAFAKIILKEKYVEAFLIYFERFVKHVKNELKTTEPNLEIKIEEIKKPVDIIDEKTQKRLLSALYACPHGVIEMSRDIPDLVETSTNLASVKFVKKDKILVTTSQRSSVDSAKQDIANMVESVFKLAKAKVWHTDGYPGWSPNTDSEILKITKDSYKRLFKVEPVVRAIHAGLECGLFLEKYPDMDMISFGPTLRNVHSPDEKINIETVQKFWDHLVDVIKHIPEEK